MKDDKGRFYYPFPENKSVRMYVKKDEDTIWFRMDDANDPSLWEQHGWVPWGALQKAISMHKEEGKNKAFDPTKAYDINVARKILEEK
ncbi:hypothetical protein [Desulfohalovibrio reitneri]|uniref:hypothetical protein n=1 Tax=Desulfohalovibrio reitneri TaxID=1307759 RepID=UPI0004A6B784|nr:hypothetical protein [Desulfohalovibrio reitneri]